AAIFVSSDPFRMDLPEAEPRRIDRCVGDPATVRRHLRVFRVDTVAGHLPGGAPVGFGDPDLEMPAAVRAPEQVPSASVRREDHDQRSSRFDRRRRSTGSLWTDRRRRGAARGRPADWGCNPTHFRGWIQAVNTEAPPPGVPEKDIFPILTAAQIERISPLGRERSFEVGEILFEQGGTNRPLMVVLEGEIEILSDQDTLVTVHHPGNFSGDVDLI